MIGPQQWTFTKLSEPGTLILEVNDLKLEVAQYTATNGLNSIPAAQCLVPVGRDARSLSPATINKAASSLRMLVPAKVTFTPKGECKPGTKWPGAFVIFEGYYVGYSFIKVCDKLHVMLRLSHWSLALTFSSAITAGTHPGSHSDLTLPAVLAAAETLLVPEPYYLSHLPGVAVIEGEVESEFWGSVKKLLCGLSELKVDVAGSPRADFCGAAPNPFTNVGAKEALRRIEGPGGSCKKAYKYSKAYGLINLASAPAKFWISHSIASQLISSFVGTTFWDKLIELTAAYGLAFVPGADFGLMVPHTPALNLSETAPWRVINPEDYTSFDDTSQFDKALRAVGVFAEAAAGVGIPEASGAAPPRVPVVQGCFAPANADQDGLLLFVRGPEWLQAAYEGSIFDPGSLVDDKAMRTDTTPDATGGGPQAGFTYSAAQVDDARRMFSAYAREVYVNEALRGRNMTLSGRLRFDIGPGSLVRINAKPEKFLAGADQLASDAFGCVVRVTILINAESSMAATSFLLSHVRTAAENNDERFSVTEHPIFGAPFIGAPLVDGHEKL